MTRSRKLVYLLIALIIVVAAAVVFTKLNLETGFSEKEEEKINIFTVDAESVTALAWTCEDTTLSFENQDSEWIFSDDSECPVDTDRIDNLVDSLLSLTASKTIEAPDDLEQYGLDDPDCTITLTADTTYEIQFGNETDMGGQFYLSTGDGNVYLINSNLSGSFSDNLYDFVEKEEIPSMSEIQSLVVKSANRTLELCYLEDSDLTYSNAYNWFAYEDNSYKALDTDLTSSFLSNIKNLVWSQCVDYKADSAALAEYGLDKPVATVTVNYVATEQIATGETDENGNEIYEEKREDAQFVLEIGNTTDDYCYARIAGSGMIYKITGSISESMQYTTVESLLPDEVILMDWDTVTDIDITLDGETYTLSKAEEDEDTSEKDKKKDDSEDEDTSDQLLFTLDGEEVDIRSITDSLDALTISREADDKTPLDTEIVFTFHTDNQKHPEVTLVLYEYDISNCLAIRNSDSTYLVSRDSVTSLIDAVKDILED